MGAYDGNSRGELAYARDTRSQWSTDNPPPVDVSISNLVDRFSGISVGGNDPSKESLFQVMKAVEAAENTIKNQATLRGEFQWLSVRQIEVQLGDWRMNHHRPDNCFL